MDRILRRFLQSSRRGESGQAFLEFAFIAMMLIIMLFALIDIGRFIYERQVMVNLSREGANLASRGTGNSIAANLTNAVNAVIASANPLDLNARGRVILTAVVNANGSIRITNQYARGGLTVPSKVGTGAGTAATIPVTSPQIPQTNQPPMYVAEVFYTFTPITPIGALLQIALPTNSYDVAYF